MREQHGRTVPSGGMPDMEHSRLTGRWVQALDAGDGEPVVFGSTMENSFSLTINGVTVLHVEDCDQSTIADALARLSIFSESVRKFGIKHTLRVIAHDATLARIVFAEADGGSGLVSTLVK